MAPRLAPKSRFAMTFAVSILSGACAGQDGTARSAAAVDLDPDTLFTTLVERLSEPGGYFDTDNLISNEASYLHVVPSLEELRSEGAAYIGVGPDQNFSYIAATRPSIAFIVDIRRDNLLQHLLFRALFEQAPTRVEFLSRLYGRPTPPDPSAWAEADVAEVVAWVDASEAESNRGERIRAAVAERVRSLGVPLASADLETIDRFHLAFIEPGLDLRFTSFGRPARFFYPTHRQLLMERDLDGRHVSYMASEDRYRRVRDLQSRGRVVPVVGDLAGRHAMAEIGRYLRETDTRLSVLYTSNVEFYLWRNGGFGRFVDNLESLPWSDDALIVRSHFGGGFRASHPQAVPGYYSTQLLQRWSTFESAVAAGGFRGYEDLVTRGLLDPRP